MGVTQIDIMPGLIQQDPHPKQTGAEREVFGIIEVIPGFVDQNAQSKIARGQAVILAGDIGIVACVIDDYL